MTWLLILLLACKTQAPCDLYQEGLDRDTCLHDQILATDDLNLVTSLARQIGDPIVRSAAVYTWVAAHNRELSPTSGGPLCDLLDSRERQTCQRKLTLQHLR